MKKIMIVAVLTSLILAFCVICPDGSIAVAPTTVSDITEGQTISASGDGEKYYRFVPSTSGMYRYQSTGSGAPLGKVLDSDGNVLYSNDDIGYNSNFSIVMYLNGGSVYYLGTEVYGSDSEKYSIRIVGLPTDTAVFDVTGEYTLYDSGNTLSDYIYPISVTEVNNLSSKPNGYDINLCNGDLCPVGTPFSFGNVLISDVHVSMQCTDPSAVTLYLDDLTLGTRVRVDSIDAVPANMFIVGHLYVLTLGVDGDSTSIGVRSLGIDAEIMNVVVAGHNPDRTVVHPATCTADGYAGIVCSDCGGTVDSVPIPATGHSYTRDGLDYSCSNNHAHDFSITLETQGEGSLSYEGGDYGGLLKVTAIPEVGHSFAGWYSCGAMVSDSVELSVNVSEEVSFEAVFEPTVVVDGASLFLGHVYVGTEFGDIDLPSTVNCISSDGSTVPVMVDWNSSGYDKDVLGGFIIHATIPEPYIVLGADVYAYGEIVDSVSEPILITSILVPSSEVRFGDSLEPCYVTGVAEDISIPMAVFWDLTALDTTNLSTYTVSGIVTVPYGYVLGDPSLGNVTMDVTVVPLEILSINAPDLGVLPLDSTVDDLGLPSSVSVNVYDGMRCIPVKWDTSGLSFSKGEHTVSGEVLVPYGYCLSDDIDGSVEAGYTISSIVSDIADVVFVLDTTGSMEHEIKNVMKNISEFAEGLLEKGVSVRLALVEYRDIAFDGADSTKIHVGDSGNWFTDPLLFAEEIGKITVSGGGDKPETVIDALEAARSLDYRAGAYRFVIVVTDDGYKVDNSYGVSDMQEEIGNMVSDSIHVSFITSYTYLPEYQGMIDSTEGAFLNIWGKFRDGLDELVWVIDSVIADGEVLYLDLISSPWRTEYRSGEYFDGTGMVVDAVFDNGERTLEYCSITPAKALSVSDTYVTVHYHGATLDIPIAVVSNDIPVTGVSFDELSVVMGVGDDLALTYAVEPGNASVPGVVWVSSDMSCVTVSNGVIHAKSAGSAVITVSTLDGGYYAMCTVTVYDYTRSDGLSLDTEGLILTTGMSHTFTTYPSWASVEWYCSDDSVCKVSDGIVVALRPGLATVSAVCDGEIATCQVLVKAVATFTVEGYVYTVQKYNPGSVVNAPDPGLYGFSGWNGYYDGMTISHDMTFEAEFDWSVCVIVFDTGTRNLIQTVAFGDPIIAPSIVPVKANEGGKYYSFVRWDGYTEGMVANGGMYFEAVYDCSVCHTVTVKYNDGVTRSYLVQHGQKLENVPDVYMYFSNSSCTKVWSSQNSVTKDLVLYATIEVSGDSGPNIHWVFRFDTGVFKITGKGSMKEYSYNSQRPWHEYRNYIRELVVEEGVNSIGSRSFSGCNSLVSVTLADSVASLGKYAFLDDGNLEYFSFGESLRSVKYQALQGITFQYQNGVKASSTPDVLSGSVFIGKGSVLRLQTTEGDWGSIHWRYDRYTDTLTISGNGVMPNCEDPTDIPWYYFKEDIKTLIVEEGITSLGVMSFRRFTSLEKVELPTTLTNISKNAFQYVSTIKVIEFGTKLNNVGWNAFESMSFKLLDGTDLKADASILSGSRFSGSGDGVLYMISTQGTSGDLTWYLNADVLRFEGTGSMEDYKKPSLTPWYTYRLFIRTVVVEEGVTHIGDYAFQNYRSLSNVYLPDSLISIGYHGFYQDLKIKHIEFGTGLKSLGTYAFYGFTFKEGSKPMQTASANLRGHTFEGGKGVLVMKS